MVAAAAEHTLADALAVVVFLHGQSGLITGARGPAWARERVTEEVLRRAEMMRAKIAARPAYNPAAALARPQVVESVEPARRDLFGPAAAPDLIQPEATRPGVVRAPARRVDDYYGRCSECGDPLPSYVGGDCDLCGAARVKALRDLGRLP